MRNGWVSRWKIDRKDIDKYTTMERSIYFSIGLSYIEEGVVTVVDIGSGLSEFSIQVLKKNKNAITYSLDANADTIEELTRQGYKARRYNAPERLPFKDEEIGCIHCSHLIEHLEPHNLYSLFQEFTRVLSNKGILIVSTPTLWDHFYDDLSHVRPYPLATLDKYLTSTDDGISNTRKYINQFRREAVYYRYAKNPIFSKQGLRGNSWWLDLIVLGLKKLGNGIGIYNLSTTGYTVIYRKETTGRSCD